MSAAAFRAATPPVQLALRADPADAALMAALAGAAALDLPRRVGGVARRGGRTALRLGPDEWLLVSDAEGEAAPLAAALEAAIGDRHATVVDVSAARVATEIEGPGAADLLAAGCPLDLATGAFAPGTCAATVLGRIEALIERQGEARWRVFVRRSYAGHFDAWLRAVAADLSAAP